MGKPRPRSKDLNHILGALPPGEYRRVASKLEEAPFHRGQSLQEPDGPIPHVYFPRTGIASIVTRMSEGGTIEVATIGNEGIVGLSAYLGNGRASMEAFVQVPGDAVRMTSAAFRQEVRTGTLGNIIRRYSQAFVTQIGQTAACNRVHSVAERCARWLLMLADRVPGDEFSLTQEFLAEMLGVRRATVTVAAGQLKKPGLIDYRRGRIRILDRKGLERAACECYKVIRSEHENLVG